MRKKKKALVLKPKHKRTTQEGREILLSEEQTNCKS